MVGFSDGLGFWFTCISNAVAAASLAQLVEHALRKRMVTGSIPVGGYVAARMHRRPACNWIKVAAKVFNNCSMSCILAPMSKLGLSLANLSEQHQQVFSH